MKYVSLASIILSLFLFWIGGMIYLIFRVNTLNMFHWVEILGMSECIGQLRNQFGSISIPFWAKFALPDGLWVVSYVIMIGTVWNFCFKRYCGYALLLPGVAILTELFQGLGLMKGTFDWIDLLCYVTGAISGFGYLKLIENFINKKL